MSPLAVAASSVVALVWIPAASASQLTNRDDKDHKVAITVGETTEAHILKPAAALDGICMKGCVIRLDDSENDEYELQGSEVVSIEDGYLYYDGPTATAVPKVDDADQPAAPDAR